MSLGIAPGLYDPDARTHPHVEADDPAGEAETVLEAGRVARWTGGRDASKCNIMTNVVM